MKYSDLFLASKLKETTSRWRRLRFFHWVGSVCTLVCLAYLALGVAIQLGWIQQWSTFALCAVSLGLVGMLGFLVLLILIFRPAPHDSWFAQKLEQVQPLLLDRLNTAIFLDESKTSGGLRWYARRIRKQAQDVFLKAKTPYAFSRTRFRIQWILFALTLTVTWFFFDHYTPLKHLKHGDRRTTPTQPVPPPDMIPPANTAEEQKPWGEVRIIDPGHDLHVTKVDAVALQIEAAANQTITNVQWHTTLNGDAEVHHPLPPPASPRYAVYQPVVYLDEYKVQEWDVLTYYSSAKTEQNHDYASEIYFLEIRPFREDLLKMKNGRNGKAVYEFLSQLTHLIEEQQHIIRQTYRFHANPPGDAQLQEQDRQKLGDAEQELEKAVRLLYADIATKMEDTPIGDVLDHLALAEPLLKGAAGLLFDNQIPEAENKEREALKELIATRKNIQKVLKDQPDSNGDDKESTQTTQGNEDPLKGITEFRNEMKAAEEFVRELRKKQEELNKRIPTTPASQLSKEERELARSLKDFKDEHPRPFEDVAKETEDARQSMEQTANQLDQTNPASSRSAQQTTQKLDQLQQKLEKKSSNQQLANTFKLKEMLDKEMEKYGEMEKWEKPDSKEHLEKMTQKTKDTLSELKKASEEKAAKETFGPKLREALSDPKMNESQSKLDQLATAQSKEAQQQAAHQVGENLKKISDAFEASQPEISQKGKKQDSFKDDAQNSLEQGIKQLQSMAKRLEDHHPLPQQDAMKERQETAENLKTGLLGLYGDNENSKKLIALIDDTLKKDPKFPIDIPALRKLLDEIEHFSAEAKDPDQAKSLENLNKIDPSHFPPAYKDRIQNYFKKLSEEDK